MKSLTEIKKTIELLKLQRQTIPRYDLFGSDNHESIDRQVNILEDSLHLDEVEIWDLADDTRDEGDESALAAFDWVLDETDEDLVEEDDIWVKKAKGK